MKKYCTLLLTLALLATLSLPVLAADVSVDGKPVTGAAAVTMIPLRAVSEALGFSVTWDGSLPGARVDNGQAHIDLTLGRDQYQLVSTTAIGMSAPFSLGAAPAMLEKGVIYVPAELFCVLLGNRADAVTIGADGAVSISASGETGSVQLPNPLHEHESLEALKAAVGFDFAVPDAPAGFECTLYQDIGGSLAELRWSDGVQELTYRVSRGTNDNSGDYTVYPTSGTLTVGNTDLQWRGDAGGVRVVLWTRDDFSCSLRAADGLTETQLRHMVESVL